MPRAKRLFVHRPDARESLALEIAHQMPADESARPGDHNQVIPGRARVVGGGLYSFDGDFHTINS